MSLFTMGLHDDDGQVASAMGTNPNVFDLSCKICCQGATLCPGTTPLCIDNRTYAQERFPVDIDASLSSTINLFDSFGCTAQVCTDGTVASEVNGLINGTDYDMSFIAISKGEEEDWRTYQPPEDRPTLFTPNPNGDSFSGCEMCLEIINCLLSEFHARQWRFALCTGWSYDIPMNQWVRRVAWRGMLTGLNVSGPVLMDYDVFPANEDGLLDCAQDLSGTFNPKWTQTGLVVTDSPIDIYTMAGQCFDYQFALAFRPWWALDFSGVNITIDDLVFG